MIVGVYPATGISSAHTIQITTVSSAAQRVVSIGNWYKLSDGSGWTFRPETDIVHVELALYDSTTALAAGTTPFEQHQTRTSGLWPDGPENELGELGYEVSPDVLGDNNQHLYGKPHYRSIRLYGSAFCNYRIHGAQRSAEQHVGERHVLEIGRGLHVGGRYGDGGTGLRQRPR